MARQEDPLERDGSPAREFAFWLRDLRNRSGYTYDQLARRTNYSTSTLQEAAAGRRLPSRNVTLAFVKACGGDVEAWQSYWNQLKRFGGQDLPSGTDGTVAPPWATSLRSADVGAVAAPADPPGSPPRPEPTAPVRSGRRLRLVALVAGAAAVVLATAITVAYSGDEPAPVEQSAPAAPKVVLVQNKVAIGPDRLLEDTTSAYLSAEPGPRCAARGCKLDGTEMWSGTLLPVVCWLRGVEVTNEDTTSAGIDQNTHGVTSRLWYQGVWPDGRTGYLAEVYVDPGYRGGLALPECPPNNSKGPVG